MPHPIIILEGPDGTGKSTLAEAITDNYYPAKVIHLTYRFKDKMPSYHTAALELALKLSRESLVILDRWWPSEGIYAEAYRGGTRWPYMGTLLHRVAQKHGLTYVICLPEDKDRYLDDFNRLKDNRKELFNSGMDRVYDGYAKLHQEFYWWPRYDRYKYEGAVNEYARMILDGAAENTFRKSYRMLDRTYRNFCGNPQRPIALLVGEKANHKSRREMWPFFQHANSSLWLAGCLAYYGIPAISLAFTNIYRPNGDFVPDEVESLITEIEPELIVSLGARAKGGLRALGRDPEISLKHPAYVQRFNNGSFEEYKELRLIKDYYDGNAGGDRLVA